MLRKRVPGLFFLAGILAFPVLTQCNSIIGLDKMKVGSEPAIGPIGGSGGDTNAATGGTSTGGVSGSGGGDAGPPPECTTNAQCTDRYTREAAEDAGSADAGADGAPSEAGTDGAAADAAVDAGPVTVPGICLKPDGKCAKLVSEDCHLVTGNYLSDDAIVIGSLYVLTGSTASQNQQRQQGATLAVTEIDNTGIPGSVVGTWRQLVMVSCDATNLVRAATHLVKDVHVPAIVGPNTSQDTLDVSTKVTVQENVLVVSPTAVAASIAELPDKGLTWLMIPSDAQRTPLMIVQIGELETQLKTARAKTTIKLGIVYRDDALGQGTFNSLSKYGLRINGNTLAAEMTNGNVRVDSYTGTQTDYSSIINGQAAFGADIIVLAGTAEVITGVMTPLETAWTATDRPYYLGIDPFKGPQLLSAVAGKDDLRRRWRGTGTTPGPASVTVNNTFLANYQRRFGAATASGCGASYDASYAIAYALAATNQLPVTGPNIAQGLRKLAGGTSTIGTGQTDLFGAFQELTAGNNINGIGTLCPLAWDDSGSVSAGTIEIWCIGLTSGTSPTPQYQSSSLTWDIQAQQSAGNYVQCGP
jgi:ABC-type branched-subunit amino acid transport system substrate-binding protein